MSIDGGFFFTQNGVDSHHDLPSMVSFFLLSNQIVQFGISPGFFIFKEVLLMVVWK